MDFLLPLPQRRLIVVKLDGVQHYADASGHADRDHASSLMDNFFTRFLVG